MIDRAPEIVDPRLQREVAGTRSATPKRERHRCPAEFVRGAVDQLREGSSRVPGVDRPDREPVAENEAGKSAGTSGRLGEIPRHSLAAGEKGAIHQMSGTRLAMQSMRTGL